MNRDLVRIRSLTPFPQLKLSGVADPGATVTVSALGTPRSVWREREGAWKVYTNQLSGTGKWGPVSVSEMLAGQPPVERNGFKFVERTSATIFSDPPTLGYDADGNQTIDPRWNHTWDAENRLIKSETRPNLIEVNPTMPRERITYTYDAQWRRATKKVEIGNSGNTSWVIQSHMRYGYEGWNLIAEWDIKTSPTKLVRSHHWGVDISGTRSGAGGVGGLVMTRHHTLAGVNGTKATIPAYDGTGNILAYLDTADGKTVASYEYGPFGEPLRESGLLAKAHPHRWSSKYTDEETGFSYYGYRYYVPSAGGWLSRDPREERGGWGLYGFVYNNTSHWIDIFGLNPFFAAAQGVGAFAAGDLIIIEPTDVVAPAKATAYATAAGVLLAAGSIWWAVDQVFGDDDTNPPAPIPIPIPIPKPDPKPEREKKRRPCEFIRSQKPPSAGSKCCVYCVWRCPDSIPPNFAIARYFPGTVCPKADGGIVFGFFIFLSILSIINRLLKDLFD